MLYILLAILALALFRILSLIFDALIEKVANFNLDEDDES